MVHGIPHVATFIVLWNMIMDSSFFMSLGILWLKDAKVAHAWNNNIFAIQRNETIRIIITSGCPWPKATVKFYKFYFFLFFTLYLVYSFLKLKKKFHFAILTELQHHQFEPSARKHA
jgi:hypothetical protein